MITLGSKVLDTVTGFTGIAESYIVHKNGCVRISIQARVDKDGKIPESSWFDIDDIELVGEIVITRQLLQVPDEREPGGSGRSTPPSFR